MKNTLELIAASNGKEVTRKESQLLCGLMMDARQKHLSAVSTKIQLKVLKALSKGKQTVFVGCKSANSVDAKFLVEVFPPGTISIESESHLNGRIRGYRVYVTNFNITSVEVM